MSDFVTEKTVTARKPHRCYLCNKEINAEEEAVIYSGCYKRRMFRLYFHSHCSNMTIDFCNEEGESEFDKDLVNDWLAEQFCRLCDQENDESCPYSRPSLCPIVIDSFRKNPEKEAAAND